MRELPTGTVTFLFTDVEGSTRLLHELGDGYAGVLAEHRRVLRDAFTRHGGVEVDTQGDAFFVAFAKASAALAAAGEARAALGAGPIRVRIGLHTGEPLVTDEGYVGVDVHRAARIAAAGHGGQILVSQSTRDLAGALGLRDLGEHRLKDLPSPERIYQLGEEDFPPLKSLNNSNLPLPAEPLIGRKKELVEVLRMLREGSRLVTLTGPGGIGKTRFALDVAAELVDSFRDGVWWIGLAPVRDAKLVLPTIAAAIGAKTQLENELKSRHVLLLLDNVEQVVAAASDLAALQRGCPHLTLLVTSREPLHIAGEREYPLPPLPEAPAVELFRRRADATQPNFAAPHAQLVELCDRLDRLPLAIELAAARTKTLSVEVLLQRLEQRLPLLTSRRRDVDERQRTIRATIEWSYDLLDDDESECFARLGVFAGSFDAGAAGRVCGADLDALESLVDKSLLRHTRDDRFFMLETIREYARERHDELPDRDGLQRAHAAWIASLAISAVEELRTSRQAAVLEQLARELPNIRAALRFAIDDGDANLALTIVGSLGRFWVFRGYDREAAAWLGAALALPDGLPDAVRWRALYWHSVVAVGIGDKAGARASVESALTLARELDDPVLVEASVIELVRALLDERDWPRAERLIGQALEEERSDRDGRGVAILQAFKAMLLLTRGDAARAKDELSGAVALVTEAGDTQLTQGMTAQLALVKVALGETEEARAALRRSVDLCAELQYGWGLATCLEVAAELAVAEREPEAAAMLLLRAEQIYEAIGGRPSGFDAVVHEQAWKHVTSALDAGALELLRRNLRGRDLEDALEDARRYLD